MQFDFYEAILLSANMAHYMTLQTTLLVLQLKFSDQECVTDAYPPEERYDCNGYYISPLVKLISRSVILIFMNNFFLCS